MMKSVAQTVESAQAYPNSSLYADWTVATRQDFFTGAEDSLRVPSSPPDGNHLVADPGVCTFVARSNKTTIGTKSRRDALKIAQDASPGISWRRHHPKIGS